MGLGTRLEWGFRSTSRALRVLLGLRLYQAKDGVGRSAFGVQEASETISSCQVDSSLYLVILEGERRREYIQGTSICSLLRPINIIFLMMPYI